MYVSRLNLESFSQKLVTEKEEKKKRVKLQCKACSGNEIIEKAKTSRQKAKTNDPDDSLEHLKVDAGGQKTMTAWAKAFSYNAAVSDLTTIKCYVCGGPGHFFEVCPLH